MDRPPPPPALADTRQALHPRSLDRLPRRGDLAALLSSGEDAILLPDLGPAGARRPGWLDPFGAPYLLVLHDAVFYPRPCLPTGPPRGPVPPGMGRKDQGLLVAAGGALYPDSFTKSHFLPSVLHSSAEGGPWRADLPEVADRLAGTHLFAELACGQFGHAIVDATARLWPLGTGLLGPHHFDGALGMGLLGAGPRGQRLPAFARDVFEAIGLPPGRLRITDRPVRVERLIVPRRIAPFRGLMHPCFGQTLRQAGRRIAGAAPPGDRPRRLYLSRARLARDPRGGPALAALDALFARHGFTVVHPQDLPLAEQVALVRGATHVAGPVGSQLHLCAFSETPGLRVFTVAPDHFRLDINARMVRDLGGDETHFLVPAERPEGPRHQAPWTFPADLLPRLDAAVRSWLSGG